MNRGLENIVLVLFAFLCFLAFGEVIARYVFNAPFFWSEELIIYTFTWVSFLGAALALKNNRHVVVTYFISLLPRVGQYVAILIADLIVLTFLGLLLVQSVLFWGLSHTLRSIALNIPLSLISASLVVMAVLMIFYLVDAMVQKYRAFRAGKSLLSIVGPASADELLT
jgi:TRAP-type C4-dicarboxylate transport system permease small subunit